MTLCFLASLCIISGTARMVRSNAENTISFTVFYGREKRIAVLIQKEPVSWNFVRPN